MRLLRAGAIIVCCILLHCGAVGAAGDAPPPAAVSPAQEEKAMKRLELQSAAFKEGETIPKKHACAGADVSPSLTWAKPPEEAKSLALLCEDPDAPVGLWVHWVLWNLPADSTSLPEGVPPEKVLPSHARQGKNDFRKIGYGGPCPPPGKPHRYFFKLYALDRMLDLEAGATRKDLLKAIDGHVVAEGQLMGRFAR